MMMIQALISPQFKLPPNKWLSFLVPTVVVTKMSFTVETCTCTGKETVQAQAAVARDRPG